MLRQYWSEMFAEFEVSSGKFEIPGFPEKLMSAHYDVKNLLGPTLSQAEKSFRICSYKALGMARETDDFKEVKVESLKNAILKEEFWKFQRENQPEVYGFIERLLPFLSSRPLDHLHYSVSLDGKIAASVIAGVAPSAVFLFNALVDRKQRKMGFGRKLLNKIRLDYYKQSCFFWTVHGYLGGDAHKIEEMHLISDV